MVYDYLLITITGQCSIILYYIACAWHVDIYMVQIPKIPGVAVTHNMFPAGNKWTCLDDFKHQNTTQPKLNHLCLFLCAFKDLSQATVRVFDCGSRSVEGSLHGFNVIDILKLKSIPFLFHSIKNFDFSINTTSWCPYNTVYHFHIYWYTTPLPHLLIHYTTSIHTDTLHHFHMYWHTTQFPLLMIHYTTSTCTDTLNHFLTYWYTTPLPHVLIH